MSNRLAAHIHRKMSPVSSSYQSSEKGERETIASFCRSFSRWLSCKEASLWSTSFASLARLILPYSTRCRIADTRSLENCQTTCLCCVMNNIDRQVLRIITFQSGSYDFRCMFTFFCDWLCSCWTSLSM